MRQSARFLPFGPILKIVAVLSNDNLGLPTLVLPNVADYVGLGVAGVAVAPPVAGPGVAVATPLVPLLLCRERYDDFRGI